MKRMQVAGDEIHEAVRFVKTATEITGFDQAGNVSFKASGINSPNAFVLLDGAEWDVSPEDEMRVLKKRLSEAENALLGLMEMNAEGGL